MSRSSRADITHRIDAFVFESAGNVLWAGRFDQTANRFKSILDSRIDIARLLRLRGVDAGTANEALDLAKALRGIKQREIRSGKLRLLLRSLDEDEVFKLLLLIDGEGEMKSEASVLQRVAAALEEETKDLEGENVRRTRVLVVDDNEMSVELSERMLRKLGCVVLGAHSGGDGLALSGRNDFDVVLMDLNMPGMGGVESGRLIRQRAMATWGREPKLIGLSAGFSRKERAAAIAGGFSDLIRKPLETNVLKKCIDPLLKKGKSRSSSSPSRKRGSNIPILNSEEWGESDELRERMIKSLLDQGRGLGLQFDGARAASDWARMGQVIHAFKGGADILRADRLSRAAEELQGAIRDGATKEIDILYAKLQSEWIAFENFVSKEG